MNSTTNEFQIFSWHIIHVDWESDAMIMGIVVHFYSAGFLSKVTPRLMFMFGVAKEILFIIDSIT